MQTQSAPQRHLPIRKDWLAATQEKALEPDRPIIDPHHHLWDRPGNRYLLHDLDGGPVERPQHPRHRVSRMPRDVPRRGAARDALAGRDAIRRRRLGDERERQIRRRREACAGIIGNVDLRAVGGRAKGILEQHIVASGGRFRGIRNGATWHADPSLRVFTSGSGEGLYVDRASARGSPRWRR